MAVNYKTDQPGADATCATIGASGGESRVIQADIGSKEDFERMVEFTFSTFGRLDILVNNAARTRFAPLFEVTEDDFADVINTNLKGPLFGTAAAARKMLATGGGSVINISSCAARLMIPFHPTYTMAKGGLEALTTELAIELAPGIRVNAIAPGPTSNERNRGYDEQYDEHWGAVIPAGRVASVNDIAGVCAFLASDDSAYVTGQIIGVDGGWTLRGLTPDLSRSDFSKDRQRG